MIGKKQDRPLAPAELIAAGELVFGSRWRTPMAKALGLSDRIIRYYQSGERRIPPAIAAKIRALVNVGPVGTVIRATVRKVAPEVSPYAAHRIARQIVVDLGSLGMLANISSHGQEALSSQRNGGLRALSANKRRVSDQV